jgi:hypothetical protein
VAALPLGAGEQQAAEPRAKPQRSRIGRLRGVDHRCVRGRIAAARVEAGAAGRACRKVRNDSGVKGACAPSERATAKAALGRRRRPVLCVAIVRRLAFT